MTFSGPEAASLYAASKSLRTLTLSFKDTRQSVMEQACVLAHEIIIGLAIDGHDEEIRK